MNSATQIDSLIATHAAKVDSLRRELELAEAELRGMQKLRTQLLGLPRAPVAEPSLYMEKTGDSGYRAGRQRGAISQPWREILSELYWDGGQKGQIGATFDIKRVILAAQKRGVRLRPSEVQARMAHYETFDYVGSVPGGYRVSMAAAERFGFIRNPLTNKAPNADAQEPHEIPHPGDQTGAV
ncbi:hypothetical protein [Rhodoblastus sp.]|uniref:hypothetical protein n=1 Tax=Rhodoblastus sp. TaxID=1962975 RepID=UPI003F9BCD8F